SETKFHTLFENAGDAILLMQDDRFVECNSRTLEVFSCQSRDQIVGQSPIDFSPPLQPNGRDSRELAMEKIAAALAGLPQRFEWMHTRSDGTPFPAEVTLNAVELGGAVLLQAIVRDVLERKRAEEERERAFAMLEASLEQSPSAIVIANAPDVTIRWANSAALDLGGETDQRLTGIDVSQHSSNWQVFRPDGSPYPPEELPLSRAILGGETIRGEEFIIHNARGENRWVFANAAPIRDRQGAIVSGIFIFHDVTEHKLAEAVLRESEARFRTLFDLIPVSMAIHDPDGRLVDGNATFCRHCGRSREGIAGRFISDFYQLHDIGYREEDLDSDRTVLGEALRRPVELRVVHCVSGRTRIVLLSSVTITLDGKQRFLACALDITDLRQVEQQFRQAQKMEAIGRLAGGVAHDFNNLLMVIGGYTRLAMTELSEENRLYGSLLEVSKASEHAASLTRQLLAFSRNQALAPAVVDLNALILDTAKMLRRLIGEEVDLGISLTEGLPSVRVDAGQTVQVLMNLAVNARDAMPEGGRLVIETAVVEVGEERARTSNLRPGAHVCLRVKDTGAGMDEETQSHIFEPFFTTKPAGQGTGLGLATVYGIVRQSGGSIAASSQPGAGSVFEILLPAAAPAELARERPQSEVVLAGRETVLLVADDDAIRELFMQVLGRAGYMLLQVANGEDALAVARSHEGPIDLLVTDLKMPGISGLEVACTLRKERPDLAVLYMSGHSSGGTLDEAQADAKAELIWKPFSPGALLKHARRALDARRSSA
ncbi:MAG: PAS domain S-box protein, partial [Bryobacteraceae bacterium]